LLRFYLIAGLSLLLGGVLAFSGLGNVLGLAAFYAGIGLVLCLTGGLTLRSYLLATQTAQEGI
jgi:hypothetical protein